MLIKTVLAACIAATFSLTALPSMAAHTETRTIWVRQAPPEVRVEQVPAARHGYQWVPGYWGYQGRHHVWHSGTWVRERHGHIYVAPTWVEHDGRWQLQRGQWRRHDRDGDGVPNSQDRRPDDPTRH